MFKEMREDYRRHGRKILNPSVWALWNYRYGVWVNKLRFKPFRWFLSKFYGWNLFFIMVNGGVFLNRETQIGEKLHLIHPGNIWIAPEAIIGDRCGIQQGVTIGKINNRKGAPVIGNDVFIGAGAKILGPVTIGDNSVIGANSFVHKDVPANCTAIGVPAKIIRQSHKDVHPEEHLDTGHGAIRGKDSGVIHPEE